MTSKETFEQIIKDCKDHKIVKPLDSAVDYDTTIGEYYEEEIEDIQKGLDVLEILKEDCVDIGLLKQLTESYPLEEARCKYNHEYAHTSYLDGRAFQLIKEWLENE